TNPSKTFQATWHAVRNTWFTPAATPSSPEPSSAEENPEDSFISQILLEELATVAAEASSKQQAETGSVQQHAAIPIQQDDAGQTPQGESTAEAQTEAHQNRSAPMWLHARIDALWSYTGFE
ncbi:MAG: hypothetical protein Q9226_008719, partial [Calogaya cf. arnoldii]